MRYNLDQQITEVEREIAKRVDVYPRMCARGRMTPEDARIYIEMMEAVLATLRWLHAHQDEIKTAVAERHFNCL
jgi:hypothetical protein